MLRTILALAAGVLSVSASQASVQVFATSAPSGNQPPITLTVGMDFTVNGSVTVDSLGAFTNGATTVPVAIYDVTAGTTIALTTIPASGQSYGYLFNAITPVTLSGTDTFQIAAYYSNTEVDADYNPYEAYNGIATGVFAGKPTVNFNSFDGKISFVTGCVNCDNSPDYYDLSGNGIAMAATQDVPSPYGYGAGSFTVVPEIATWAMMLGGFAGLVFAASRQGKGRRTPASLE